MSSYRLIENINNATKPKYTTYVIEKKVRFFFWTWWSTNYLWDVNGCYSYNTIEEAVNMMRILTGKIAWNSKKIIMLEYEK